MCSSVLKFVYFLITATRPQSTGTPAFETRQQPSWNFSVGGAAALTSHRDVPLAQPQGNIDDYI